MPPVSPEPGRHPVLLFLHGYDEAAPAPLDVGLTRHGPLRPGNPPIALSRFIVIAPQLPAAGDIWERYAAHVFQIVEDVIAVRHGDVDRVYLTGFSFGGNGVFDLALRDPGVWAALWSVDPTRVPAEDPGLPIWLSSGALSRRRKTGFIDRLRLEEDADVDERMRVHVDNGLDHVGTAAAAYADARIYEWLLRHRRA